MNVWVVLGMAIALEISGTSFLKLSNGFEKIGYGMIAMTCYALSFWFFAPVLKVIPTGVAYAIWAGVGIVGVNLIGLIIFKQTLNGLQYSCVALILIGAVGLNLTTQT